MRPTAKVAAVPPKVVEAEPPPPVPDPPAVAVQPAADTPPVVSNATSAEADEPVRKGGILGRFKRQPKTEPGATGSANPGGGSQIPDWRPVVDHSDGDTARYEHDLSDCQAYAVNAPGTNAKREGLKSAKRFGIGTLVGIGVLTVATGGLGALAVLPAVAAPVAVTAGGAAVVGGVASNSIANSKYKSMVSSCLVGRGYKVNG